MYIRTCIGFICLGFFNIIIHKYLIFRETTLKIVQKTTYNGGKKLEIALHCVLDPLPQDQNFLISNYRVFKKEGVKHHGEFI